eukprot:TRINITY_DN72_c0_g1_i1.p1 TRINITY_DN72_c0_g1~~TRINITY_DN72_c0_g1_i1.p1  ORF type:complete len:102 (-),score=16.90 TRINITY_DN72_c0_g1_i1:46-351(-)
MTTYIRAKRTNQTVFLFVDPSETINDVRKKLSAIVKQPVDNIRLLSTDHHPLAEEKTLSDNKLENDSVVYWVHKKEGSDAWEEVNIQKIEAPKQDQSEDKS